MSHRPLTECDARAVRCLRAVLGLTLAELGARLGMTRQAVWLWESRTQGPSAKTNAAMLEIGAAFRDRAGTRYLTDVQMRLICDLLAEGLGAAEIARLVWARYSTVALAIRGIRAHGWATPLVWHPCEMCGRPVPSLPSARARLCRSEVCRRAKERAESASRRAEHPGLSTPYTRAWREQHPDRVFGLRVREYDARRGKPRPLTPEEKARHAAQNAANQRARNDATSATADHHGEPWSSDEDQYILDHAELTNAALAIALSRTAHAIRSRKNWLRKHGILPPAPADYVQRGKNGELLWPAAHEAFLLTHPEMTAREIGRVLGRTERAVNARYRLLTSRGHAVGDKPERLAGRRAAAVRWGKPRDDRGKLVSDDME